MKAAPTDWLLERENPSVRYFTLRDILDYSDKAPEVVEARAAIVHHKKVSNIFGKQKPGGYWESAEQPYQPKHKSTYWQIMILSMLGMDKGDERVRRACEYIFRFQLEDDGFTTFKEEGAKREYQWMKKRLREKGREPPPFEAWAQEKIQEYEMACLTGNVAAALIKLGYASDGRVRKALKWLVKVQNEDGGWLCPYWKAHIRDKHGCFMGTITPLDAFSEMPKECRSSDMDVAIERGVEFLLMHRLFKADHHGLGSSRRRG